MSRRNKIALFLIILLGVSIFGYSLRDVKLNILIRDFTTINLQWLTVAILCMLIYFALEGLVVKTFVDERLGRYSFKSALRIPLIEQLFNGITPFSSGGQPAQLIAMLQSGIDGGRASSILLMKFIVYQGMIVINFLVALIIGFHYMVSKMSYLSLFVVFGFMVHFAVIIGLFLVMFWPQFTKRAMRIVMIPVRWFTKTEKVKDWITKLDTKIDLFYQESVQLIGQWRLLLKVIVITFFQLMCYYLVPYFIMLSLGYTHANIVMITCLHVLIVMVISIFPIPGGSGGAEYAFTVLFSSYITNSSKLVLAMLLWRLLTYYLGILVGMVALAVKPDKITLKSGV
ncbi:membrane protein [Secundilactobacillus pentosiphilus]|uniref:Phosphatidylglycerol lysyltransferase n=1 Tax=Secundilactobacillus pentosiphilus TaxID=1714682 RepID=A0A1Z5IPR7_9LACO|nr:lysylphosphatidylglycerol synthase transmembrane domain-containing protein [Secundilactobacillus pentosiphilus]GAX03764.1 membrane protein [Secundilactobacillus pentosiphilus]GAX05218.1 membrane protein [Secundilactobacillus pentosiphilus]